MSYTGTVIGGPWDRLHYTSTTARICVPEKSPERWKLDDLAPASFAKHEYRFVAITRDIGLWLHSSIDMPGALARLLSEYEKGTP